MYKCQNESCNKCTQTRQPEHRVIIKERKAEYSNLVTRGRDRGGNRITTGHEIVKEIRVCPDCYYKLTGQKPLAIRQITKLVNISKSRPSFKDQDYKAKTWHNPRNKQVGSNNRKRPQVTTVK